MLLALLVEEAGFDAVDGGTVGDDEAAITAAVERAADSCDALLTSGAVSVGDYDFVKVVLEAVAKERGGTYAWSQVAIKPAKPLAFATLGSVPAFGLPGNPVSSRVSFELFARPALRKLAGRHDVLPAPVTGDRGRRPCRAAPTASSTSTGCGCGSRTAGTSCERSGVQASNVLSGMAAANGLALLPDGDGVEPGAEIQVLLLG